MGHDTTAITLSWTLYLLAGHPELQSWITEEINLHITESSGSIRMYSEVFPKLKRCLAVIVHNPRS